MITVIVAGGSGTRLWPLSTPSYPKHLLKVNGDDRSLLQNTYDRMSSLSSRILVVTEQSHASHVTDQLPQLKPEDFIIEPARRGTASCIIAGLAYISKHFDHDEPIAFVPADHYIRDTEGFFHTFKIAMQASMAQKRIVLIGIEPDSPSTGLGYIEKGALFDEDSFVFNVRAFTEKPVFKIAQKYVKSGNYLWNCGMFVGSINTFLKSIQSVAPSLERKYQQLIQSDGQDYINAYLGFESEAIDYALIEKVPDLLVVPATFDWADLGTYVDMHKAAESNEDGNHIRGERIKLDDVQNSFIHNYDKTKPVTVIGLDNIVVINSDNGILVARKDLSQQIGDAAKKLHTE